MDSEGKKTTLVDEIKPFTFLDIILVFIKYRTKILIFSGVVMIISIVLYFFVFDLIYFSTATIKSSVKSTGLLGNIEGSLPDIGGLEDLGIAGGKSVKELATYEDILNSRRCIEPLIDKFNLMERDEFAFKEDAVKDFAKSKMLLNEDKLAGTLDVGVYDKDPKLAKEMVEFLLGELDKINIEINIQNAKNNREFVENRYNQAREDLRKAEDTLKAFQIVYGVAPDLQVKASAQSVFSLESEMKAEEVKLDVLKKILSPDQVEVKTQEEKVASLKNKISDIQNSTDLNDFLRLGNSPQIVLSFLRLQREVEIQGKIVSFLLPVFEQAKIEEKRETPTITVLDRPYIAERKVKPKRATMILAWTFVSFIIAIITCIILERIKLYRVALKSRQSIIGH